MAKTSKNLSRHSPDRPAAATEAPKPSSLGKSFEITTGVVYLKFDSGEDMNINIKAPKNPNDSRIEIQGGSVNGTFKFLPETGLNISIGVSGGKFCSGNAHTESKQTRPTQDSERRPTTRSHPVASPQQENARDVPMTDRGPERAPTASTTANDSQNPMRTNSSPTNSKHVNNDTKIQSEKRTVQLQAIDVQIEPCRSVICTGFSHGASTLGDLVSACLEKLDADPMDIQRWQTDFTTGVLQFRTSEQATRILETKDQFAASFPNVFFRPFQPDFPTLKFANPSMEHQLLRKWEPFRETETNSVFVHTYQASSTLNVWLDAETLGNVRRVRPTRASTCYVVTYYDPELVGRLLSGVEKFPAGTVHQYQCLMKRQCREDHHHDDTPAQPPVKRTRTPSTTAATPIGGANQTISLPLIDLQAMQHPPRSEIQQHWDQDPDSGNWHPGTRNLQRILQSEHPPRTTSDVPGDGNCAYHAFKRAAHLHMSTSYIKQVALHYVDQHEPELGSHFQQSRAAVSTTTNDEWTVPALKHTLRTPGVYANEPALCVLAWAFHREIDIYDAMTGVQWLTIPAHPPWEQGGPPRPDAFPTIALAHRRHRIYCVYNSSFEPIAAAEGHFWAIVRTSENGRGSVPHRP